MANDNPECARKFAVADKITGLLKIDLTEADVLLVMRALTQLQPEHNGERIQRWTLIETLARLCRLGQRERGEPRTESYRPRRNRVPILRLSIPSS